MVNQKPAISRVMFVHDFQLLIVVPILIVCTILAINLFDSNRYKLIGWVELVVLLVLGLVLTIINIKRYRRITFFIERGEKRRGKIIEKYTRRNQTYLAYEYKYRGRIYRTGEYFYWTPFLNKFRIEQDVIIFVNNQNPGQALLYELYT